MESLHKNIQLMLEFLKASFLVLHFSCYTLMTFLMMISVILLSMVMILLSILSVVRHLIGGSNFNWFLNLNQIYETSQTRARSGLFNAGKTQLVLFDQSNTGSIDVKMDGSEEKSSFKMLGLTFSSKLDLSPYIISIAKTASKKIGALIRSIKFLSAEVALYLCKSTIQSCMESCCHVWARSPSCYLELLDKLGQKIFLFPELRVTRKICSWAAANLFFKVGFLEIFSFLH